MALSGTDEAKFKQLCAKKYKDQAIWYLNGYWNQVGKDAETIWKYEHKCEELDLQARADGSSLDEMNGHRFLEFFKVTQTVKEMRDTLRAAGVAEKFSNVPITHFLLSLFKGDWKYLVNSSQGDNKEEVEQAQRMLVAVQKALQDSEEKAHVAAKALADAHVAESSARSKEAEAATREAEAEAAKKELEAALADLKAQEDAFNNKTADLQRKSAEGTVVSQNKAKNELSQHLASDPLPLRKAKITQEAAVKKSDKTRQAAAAARAAAQASTAAAVESRRLSEEAKESAEKAVDQARSKVDEAEAYLQEVKSKPGNAAGAIWWMERELHEVRAFLPERKGGYRKDK